MKSYVYRVVLGQDKGRWHAAVPELEAQGAATWGYSREEALRNIQEVVQMVVEVMLEDGEPVPHSRLPSVFRQPPVARQSTVRKLLSHPANTASPEKSH